MDATERARVRTFCRKSEKEKKALVDSTFFLYVRISCNDEGNIHSTFYDFTSVQYTAAHIRSGDGSHGCVLNRSTVSM